MEDTILKVLFLLVPVTTVGFRVEIGSKLSYSVTWADSVDEITL